MNGQRIKPRGWTTMLAFLLPMLACFITMVVVNQRFPDLPGILGSHMGVKDLTQVVVPGSKGITFARSGAYAVYYEYRSVVDGTMYTSRNNPPDLNCSLMSKSGNTNINSVPDYVETNTYATKGRARVGVLIQSITVNEPGSYTFSCGYVDGKSQPEIVLAVGPNLMWEFLGRTVRSSVALAAGLITLLGVGLLVMIIAIVLVVKRHRSKQAFAAGRI